MLLSMGLKESDMTEQLNNNNKYNSQIIIKIKIIFTEMRSKLSSRNVVIHLT